MQQTGEERHNRPLGPPFHSQSINQDLVCVSVVHFTSNNFIHSFTNIRSVEVYQLHSGKEEKHPVGFGCFFCTLAVTVQSS